MFKMSKFLENFQVLKSFRDQFHDQTVAHLKQVVQQEMGIITVC